MLRLRRVLPWVPVAAALLLFLAPIEPALVERWYSGRLYLQLQPRATALSNRIPFAAFDLILMATVAAVVWILTAAVRGLRSGQRWRAPGIAALRLLAIGACLYLWFLAAWGLNYRRVPLLERLELAHEAPTPATVVALGRQAVDRLNELHGVAHAAPWIDPSEDGELQRAFRVTQSYLGGRRKALPGRLKGSIIGPYFRWASVDGMTDPFALEVLANPDLLPLEKPFVAAHEWAHLAGYADESEANFVGWLSCVRASPGAQYSAWLFLYWEVSSVVSAADRAALAAALGAGPRADVAAVTERVRRGQLPQLRRVSWAAYDQYLKANRVEAGVRSYDAVITLLARARFKKDWVPVRLRAPHDAAGGGTP
ncbi:MAG TPA: DUF3810 family protein [Vicinamibacterales bacterium]|jgi:hypothetical protein|nr:DUF3810 family protein [Vicinamibacterales bacterium]